MKSRWLNLILMAAITENLFASSESVNFYELLAVNFGLSAKLSPVFASLAVLFLTTLLGLLFQNNVKQRLAQADYSPPTKPGLIFALEAICEFIYSLAQDQCHKYTKTLAPFLLGVFLFVLLNNLSGLIPGFPPATEDFNTNLSLGILVFLVYNFFGLKEHGPHYIKQFMGPILVLAPFFLVLELISHSTRPLSLAFRLMANIFADHLVLSVFSSIVPLVVPALLLFFGLLVACVQSFVFTMLTAVYISMAVSHDH